jgi:AhpD family alkylhydroperoxidase
MTGFPHIDPAKATGPAKDAFDEAIAQFGGVINLFKVAGNAPNVLTGILAMNRDVGMTSELGPKLTEQIAMLVSALNACDYCVNVHMQVGKMQGVPRETMVAAMEGRGDDPRSQALLDFTDEVVRMRGLVAEKTLRAARDAGFSNKALLEVIGVNGIYTTLQYIRHVAKPDHDFPIVGEFDAARHSAHGDMPGAAV